MTWDEELVAHILERTTAHAAAHFAARRYVRTWEQLFYGQLLADAYRT